MEDVCQYMTDFSKNYPGSHPDHDSKLIEVRDDTTFTGCRANFRIALSRVEVAAVLAVAINCFALRNFDAFLVCPKPQSPPEDESEWLTNKVSASHGEEATSDTDSVWMKCQFEDCAPDEAALVAIIFCNRYWSGEEDDFDAVNR
uniref:RGM_C domain-containing protein n=1 Tax=Syphacia muris TaxID=451379 RepID=A0A0N5ATN0_9BILA